MRQARRRRVWRCLLLGLMISVVLLTTTQKLWLTQVSAHEETLGINPEYSWQRVSLVL